MAPSAELPSKTEEALSQLRAQILDSEEKTQALKSRYNTLTPIARIPPETLSNIFMLYLKTCSGSLDRESMIPSQVCRHWRQVAIDYPFLWSKISFGTKYQADLESSLSFWHKSLFERSKEVPLAICLAIYKEPSGRTIDSIAKIIPRVKILELSGGYLPKLLQHFPDCAPLLESLSIHVPYGGVDGMWNLTVPDVFSGGSPRLQRLSFHSRAIPFSNLLLQCKTLSELTLEAYDFHYWGQLHPVLQGLAKGLKKLTLKADFQFGEDSERIPLPPINLPQLDTLIAHGVPITIPLNKSLLRCQTLSELTLEVYVPHPWNQLHSVLQGLTKTLKKLTLKANIEFEDEQDSQSVTLPTLNLLQLDTLIARGEGPGVLEFLKRIRVRRTTQVLVGVLAEHVGDSRPGLDVLKSILMCLTGSHTSDLAPRCLSISQEVSEILCKPGLRPLLQIDAWMDRPSFYHHIPVEPPSITVASFIADVPWNPFVADDWDAFGFPSPVASFSMSDKERFRLPGLSLVQLQSLSLQPTSSSGLLPVGKHFWDDIARLPNLSNLTVCPPYVKSLVKKLETDSQAIEKLIQDRSLAPISSQTLPGFTSSFPPNSWQSLSLCRCFGALKTLGFNGRGFEAGITTSGSFEPSLVFERLVENIKLRRDLGPDSALLCLSFVKWSCVPDGWAEGFSQFVSDAASYGVTVESYDN